MFIQEAYLPQVERRSIVDCRQKVVSFVHDNNIFFGINSIAFACHSIEKYVIGHGNYITLKLNRYVLARRRGLQTKRSVLTRGTAALAAKKGHAPSFWPSSFNVVFSSNKTPCQIRDRNSRILLLL